MRLQFDCQRVRAKWFLRIHAMSFLCAGNSVAPPATSLHYTLSSFFPYQFLKMPPVHFSLSFCCANLRPSRFLSITDKKLYPSSLLHCQKLNNWPLSLEFPSHKKSISNLKKKIVSQNDEPHNRFLTLILLVNSELTACHITLSIICFYTELC